MTPSQKYENDKLDIDYLTAVDYALGDSTPLRDDSASDAAKKIILRRMLGSLHFTQGRLTLESGVPNSTANQTAKTSLYFTPYKGKFISLWDGTRWNVYEFAELTLSLAGYTASKPYDIWIYDNSGTPTLDSTVWTSTTARATALATQNGVLVKSGDATRKYLGTIAVNAAGGQTDDSLNNRLVWNYYNRLKRRLITCNTTTTWTYSTAAWREANGGTGQLRGYFVVGVAEISLKIEQSDETTTDATGQGYIGTAINATNTNNAIFRYTLPATHYVCYGESGKWFHNPAIGISYITAIEYCAAGTLTIYGYGSTTSVGYDGCVTEIEG